MSTESFRKLDDPRAWKQARRYALWKDHGWIRDWIYCNLHSIDGRVYRSGQVGPDRLREIVERYGIKTVVNLRGAEQSPTLLLEAHTCDALGIELRHLKLFSRDMHSVEKLQQAHDLLNEIEYPALFHCKSGCDRVGFLSTLYVHWQLGTPVSQIRQLALRPYWHYRWAKTGLLDHFFESYVAEGEQRGQSLLDWVYQDYDPKALKRSFKPNSFIAFLVDKVLQRE